MILYFLKAILCSAIFLAAYKLLLENEKMHRFNRFYLLVAVILSFIVPLVSFEIGTKVIEPIQQLIVISEQVESMTVLAEEVKAEAATGIWNTIPLYAYGLVALLLLVRFASNITRLCRQARTSPHFRYHNASIILMPGLASSYSFMHYIFINEDAYRSGNIADEILQHELAHVRQRHTLDILFIELVSVITWMNPLLLLYKKAIRLNHEFLADEAVVRDNDDVTAYQRLLLRFVSIKQDHALSSAFHYSIIKKRLIMITKTTSRRLLVAKQFTAVIVFAAVLAFFSTKMQAQELQGSVPADTAKQAGKDTVEKVFVVGPSVGSTAEGVSESLMQEYESIIAKHWVEGKEGFNTFRQTLTAAEEARLLEIFRLMSRQQQVKQKVFFYLPGKPFAKRVPTQQQFSKWKNAKMYGILINDKRVSNAELDNYQPSDFSHFLAHRLAKNAVNYGKHYVQVNLMTNDHYNNYYQQQLKEQGKPRMAFLIRQKAGK